MNTDEIKLCCEFFRQTSVNEVWHKFIADNGPEYVYTRHPKIKKTSLDRCRVGEHVFFMVICSPYETYDYFSSRNNEFFESLRTLNARILFSHEGFNLFTFGNNIFDMPNLPASLHLL